MKKIQDQNIVLLYYNGKKHKFSTNNLSEFLFKMKEFLSEHNYGIMLRSYFDTFLEVPVKASVNKKIKAIKEYVDNLSNAKRADLFKYENIQFSLYNIRNQIIWSVEYNNSVIKNRKKLFEAMLSSNYWAYQFKYVPDNIKNLGFKILCKKHSNNFDDDYYEYMKQFKKYNLMYSLENNVSSPFYNYIIDLMKLKIRYED